jgi:hypothetical protein
VISEERELALGKAAPEFTELAHFPALAGKDVGRGSQPTSIRTIV